MVYRCLNNAPSHNLGGPVMYRPRPAVFIVIARCPRARVRSWQVALWLV